MSTIRETCCCGASIFVRAWGVRQFEQWDVFHANHAPCRQKQTHLQAAVSEDTARDVGTDRPCPSPVSPPVGAS